MKTKITQLIPVTLALLAIGFRYSSNWCIDVLYTCYGTWVHWISLSITKPLYFFALYSLPVAIILAFVSREIFKSWLKFAAWALPLVVIYIWTTPVSSTAWMDLFPFYRDDAARLAGQVFLAISLALIVWKWWKSLRSGQV